MRDLHRYDPRRPIIAIDSETARFGPGNMAPLASCWAFAWREAGRVKTELLSHREGARKVMRLLVEAIDGKWTLTFQNGPYDFAVLMAEYPEAIPLVRKALEAGAVHDTMHAEWLLDTALGLLRVEWSEEKQEYKANKSYALENLARVYLGWPPYKDEWRLRYAELRDTPISMYPEGARVYPQKDVEATLLITEIQREQAARIAPHDPLVASLAHVCRSYTALHIVACWGQELNPIDAEILYECMGIYTELFVPDLEKAGLVVRVKKGKKAGALTKKKAPLQELVAKALVESAMVEREGAHWEDVLANPMDYLDDDHLTDGGKSGNRQVKCSGDVLKALAAFDGYRDRELAKLIKTEGAFLEGEKLRTAFGAPMQLFGAGPIHSRYGWAETGRTTCSGGSKRARTGFNIQQLPRKLPKELTMLIIERVGREIDVRSCITARPGWVLSSSDYSALEACTFAQACKWLVGYSELGDAINGGVDPHTLFATDLLHCSYEEALARVKAEDPIAAAARQRSKVGNFGFPGGMGWKKFLKYARAQGVVMTAAESKELHALYRKRWPEALDYFKLASNACENGETTIVGMVSQMVRGGVNYTAWCNGNFQEQAAFGATTALWMMVMECYDETLGSVLFGSRINAFVHDEFIGEHPEDRAHEAAERIAEIGIEEMQAINPDVKISMEPALMKRWLKGAKTVRDEGGRLIPWEPKTPEKKAA